MHRLSEQEILQVQARLQKAIVDHRTWVHGLLRSLTCRLPHLADDKATTAHVLCQFGKWYYDEHPAPLSDAPAFKAIEAPHKTMHQLAASMLESLEQDRPISQRDFDLFYENLDNFVATIETLKSEVQELIYSKDPLTGAFNRLALTEELAQIKTLVQKDRTAACIIMLDLDHFKPINDTYGHPFGDRVLQCVAETLLDNLRPCDRLFRYGGEEFLITVVGTNIYTAKAIAERMRITVSEISFTEQQPPVKITSSFGVAQFTLSDTVESCVKRADKALYEAKERGRNRVQVAI